MQTRRLALGMTFFGFLTLASQSTWSQAPSAPSPSNEPVAREGWSINICRPLTLVEEITLEAGAESKRTAVFATWWKNRNVDKFLLPENLRQARNVYINTVLKTDGASEICVKWNGEPKKKFHQTKQGGEDHELKTDGATDGGCLC